MLDVVAPNQFYTVQLLTNILKGEYCCERNPTRKLCLCLDYKFIRAYVAIWKFSNFCNLSLETGTFNRKVTLFRFDFSWSSAKVWIRWWVGAFVCPVIREREMSIYSYETTSCDKSEIFALNLTVSDNRTKMKLPSLFKEVAKFKIEPNEWIFPCVTRPTAT